MPHYCIECGKPIIPYQPGYVKCKQCFFKIKSEKINKPPLQIAGDYWYWYKAKIFKLIAIIVIIGIIIYTYQIGWVGQIATQAKSFVETINVPTELKKAVEATPLSPERKDQCIAAFDSVNDLRQQNGRSLFVWDDRIYALAVFRSKDMLERGYFDHVTPEGLCAKDYKSQFGITENGVFAEDAGGTTVTYLDGIPAYYSPVQEAVDKWLTSRGHRYALLYEYPPETKAAIGCYKQYCVFLALTNEPFQCVHGAEGLAYWQTAPTQPGEI